MKSYAFVCLLLLSTAAFGQSNIFGPFTLYGPGGTGPNSVAVEDLRGDGKLDLVVASGCSQSSVSECNPFPGMVGVLLGNGDGTFQTAVAYSTGGFAAVSVAVADVNGDGKPDIVVANLCSSIVTRFCNTSSDGSIGVLLGNGDGTFQAAVTYSPGPFWSESVAVADVNGDGKLDVLVADLCVTSTCTSAAGVSVLLGNGNGTFQTAVTYSSGTGDAQSVAVADVNGDGKPDLLVANGGSVSVLLGNGNGTFQTAAIYSSGGFGNSGSIVATDVNGDGKLDLLVANGCLNTSCFEGSVGVLLGNGDGTFNPAVSYSSGGQPANSLAVADMNGDGKPDLLVANTSQRSVYGGIVALLLGNGDGTFQTAASHGEAGLDAVSIAVGDFNGDGKPDVVVADNGAPSQGGNVAVSLNASQPAASFSPSPLNFGNQTVAVSLARGVILTNSGNRPLTITSIGLSNTSSSDFVESNNCPVAPATLAIYAHCSILTTFTPSATATRSATIVVTDNAANSPQQISVTGTGVLPAVTFQPTSLIFPIQVIFFQSSPQTVTLTNTGLGELFISNLAVNGQFAQGSNCPKNMAPGKQCTFTVTFDPTTPGPLSGSISLTDNAPGSPQAIALSGTATAVQLEPRSASFGIQPVGTTSTAQTFQLSSKSHSTITITSINFTGANPGDFVQTNNCGGSVAPGASCFIKVQFAPTATGNRTATLSVSDNAGGSPLVSLSGKGI